MKILLIFFLMFSFINLFPQEMKRRHKPADKIEELKKIKLIEALDMDEETTLKFFARRNAHQQKMQNLEDQAEAKLYDIEKEIASKGDSEKLKPLINDYISTENMKNDERISFIKSLSDLLSEEQIGKLLIFERKFKDEIRKILWRERKKLDRN